MPVEIGNEPWLGRDVSTVSQLIPEKPLLGSRRADYGQSLSLDSGPLDIVLDPLTSFEDRVPVSVEVVLDVELERLKGRLIGVRTWRRR